MEALYLLCSILYTSVASLFLSLFIPFRPFLRCLYPSRAATGGGCGGDHVSLYEGTVWHDRRQPVRHSFHYSVRYALFDLDNAHDTPPDHLSANDARRVARTTGPIFLLTIPPSVGYEQNPLSVYYCYNMEGSVRRLQKCIAQSAMSQLMDATEEHIVVTNTPWGERVTFVFSPNSDLIAKPLHVSPFMDMLGNWNIRANDPGDDLYVSIEVQHPDLGNYFIATLKAKRVPPNRVSDHAIFFWLMPHKVAVWIYWHAFKLWWKNVSFIQHPRYSNPSYRKDAVLRDKKLQSGDLDGSDQDKTTEANGFTADSSNFGARCFAWREAKWPWS